MLRQFSNRNRVKLLATLIVCLMIIFAARLFYLQVIQHGHYVTLANEEQLKRLTIPAARGEIYMHDKDELAKVVLNQTVYTLFVDPKIVDEKDKVIKTVREVAGGNTVKNFSRLLDKKDTRYQVVALNVSRRQAQLIKQEKLSGVGFQAVSKRVYPETSLAAQTLGFVNHDYTGQYGVEGTYNKQLIGKDGILQSVTDVSNVPLTIGDNNIDIPAKNGDDIVLSIDRNVQAVTEQALNKGMKKSGATKGSAIVMDPRTGKVMAMANLPTYNPEEYYKVQDASVFRNDVISTPYEPGSVIKAFTMATTIDKGVLKPSSTFVNTDFIKIYDRTISNVTKGQTGTISFQHALTWSLNTGMVTAVERLGDGSINDKARKELYHYFHDKFRFGQSTEIGLNGEENGIIFSPSDAQGNAVRYSNMSFGQGMDLTMAQVTAGFCSVVNGGIYNYPTVVDGIKTNSGNQIEALKEHKSKRIIKKSTSKVTLKMLVKARKAFYAGKDRKDYVIGGKTGTSQTLINGSYENNQTVGTYLGFGGDTEPKYVIMVQVSGEGRNLSGGDHANPIFTDISNWMVDYMGLQPKGDN